MLFLNNLFVLVFFILTFGIFYFLVQRFKELPIIINLRIFSVFLDIAEGLFFGLIFYIFSIVNIINYSSFLPYFLIAYIILVIYRNPTVSAFSLIIPLITFLLFDKYKIDIYVYIGIIFIYTCVFQICNHFLDNFQKRVLSYSVLFACCLAGFLLIFFLIEQDLWFYLSNILILFIGTIWLDLLFFWGIKISISANLLQESVSYDFSTFYRSSIKNQIIANKIKTNKIKSGIFGIFQIDFLDQKVIQQNEEIVETILLKIEKFFPSRTILFKLESSRYGFFLPRTINKNLQRAIGNNFVNKRDEKDIFYEIENIFKKIKGKYLTSFDKNIHVSLNAGVSLYGIQSYSLNQLEKFALFALSNLQLTSTNDIYVFNPKEYIKNIKQKKQIDNLEKIISLDEFTIEFVPIYNLEKKKTIFNYSRVILDSESNIEYSLKQYLQSLYASDIFYRYFSSEILKTFQKQNKKTSFKITIPYPFAFLSKNFNLEEFIKKINLLQISFKKIIFEIIYYENEKITPRFFKNIKMLKDLGFEFLLTFDPDNKNKILYEKMEFNYFLFNQKNVPEELLNNQVFIFDKEPFLYKKEYKNVGGKLFFVSNNPTILEKKSKIDLDTLTK